MGSLLTLFGGDRYRPPPGWTPASIASNVDYFIREDLTRLWTTSALSTNVAAVADPVGAWRGQRNALTIIQATSTARPEYAANGIKLDASGANNKGLSEAYSRTAAAPFSFFIRNICTSTNTLYSGSTTSSLSTVCVGFSRATTTGNLKALSAVGVLIDTGTPQTGDYCCVISFDGTNTWLLNSAGLWSNVTASAGTPSGTPANYVLRALTVNASVDAVDCHGFFTGAVTETEARYLQWWARNR